MFVQLSNDKNPGCLDYIYFSGIILPRYIGILLNHSKDPMTLSEDDEGVYDHLPNPWYLASRKPFSGKVSQDA